MMSSLPSLSQSINPTPPLMDSTMYFLSGEEMCATVSPAFAATSSNCGTGCSAGVWVLDNDELTGGLAGEDCASSIAVRSHPIPRERVHTESSARIRRKRLYRAWTRRRWSSKLAAKTCSDIDAVG